MAHFKVRTKSKPNKNSLIAKIRQDRKARSYYDYNLVAVLLLLVCFGLVMLYSTSSYMANITFEDDMYFFKRQALISLASFVVVYIVSKIDYHIYMNFATLIYVVAAGLMLLVRTPLGVTVNGAKRWLALGPIQFQPSEMAKLAIIIFIPCLIIKIGRGIGTAKGFWTVFILGMAQGVMTYLFTDNLSTALIVCGITAGLLFIAHPKTRIFIVAIAVIAVVTVVTVIYLANTIESSSNFRLQRILVWLHPEDYIKGDGYQIMQAMYAIGSGGLFGKGLGNSVQKLGWVPEAQNDMIFSIVCEELGIFGGAIVLLLFVYLMYRLFVIAQNAPDLFGSLIVSGIFIHIALQVILNICVVINMIPTTGITLPFISYGGTSILFLMTEMGLALSVARQIRFEGEE